MTSDTLALSIIFLLTLNLLVVGFYIVVVLKEIRQTVKKVNGIMSSLEEFADAIRQPMINVSTMMTGIQKGLDIVHKFNKPKYHKEEQTEDEEEEYDE